MISMSSRAGLSMMPVGFSVTSGDVWLPTQESRLLPGISGKVCAPRRTSFSRAMQGKTHKIATFAARSRVAELRTWDTAACTHGEAPRGVSRLSSPSAAGAAAVPVLVASVASTPLATTTSKAGITFFSNAQFVFTHTEFSTTMEATAPAWYDCLFVRQSPAKQPIKPQHENAQAPRSNLCVAWNCGHPKALCVQPTEKLNNSLMFHSSTMSRRAQNTKRSATGVIPNTARQTPSELSKQPSRPRKRSKMA
mmetsp:Transcript_71687/g.140811  ORF Transcript_71687/g.140811 Transcript_71687/m.140811 type:complete len:251 (-) Transcript_71687:260-1012(-)